MFPDEFRKKHTLNNKKDENDMKTALLALNQKMDMLINIFMQVHNYNQIQLIKMAQHIKQQDAMQQQTHGPQEKKPSVFVLNMNCMTCPDFMNCIANGFKC